jgi:hypothetical protein
MEEMGTDLKIFQKKIRVKFSIYYKNLRIVKKVETDYHF